MGQKSNATRLFENFLDHASALRSEIEPVKVLRSRVFKIGKANVLIRAASEGNRRYFFGINYLTIEEMANLQNPYIAFICGSIDKVLIIPAVELFDNLNKISHDRNGEYKINIDKELNLVLKGRGNRLDCSDYINNWEHLLSPISQNFKEEQIEKSLHSIVQGRIIEIGNFRGFKTYCPDKSKKFNKTPLSDLSTIEKCPELQFSNYELLRNIDVLWFREKGSYLIPAKAFEVELSTGTWSGFGRLSTLTDYNDVNFYIISDDKRKYQRVLSAFPAVRNRFRHLKTTVLGDLYSAEKNIKELRYQIGL